MRVSRFWYGYLLAGLLLPLGTSHAPAHAANAQATPPSTGSHPPLEPEPQARFAKEIAAYEAADQQNPPPTGAVLFVGSSSIRLWKTLAEDFPELEVINRGFGGSVIAECTHYAPRIVLPYKPRLIVLYAGSNDIARGLTPEQVRKDFEEFVTVVHAKLPDTRIAFVSINPSVKRWSHQEEVTEANRLIANYVREQNARGAKLAYLDSHSKLLTPEGEPRADLLRDDGLHFNADGYTAWVAILRPQILELAAPSKAE